MKARTLLVLAALLTTGLATAAAAPAQTALSACGALTKGSYKLTKNLTTTGSCLTIVNNFVTIDLNGFAITGDGGSGDFGIRTGALTSLTGIEIRNGTITNFGRAINLMGPTGVLVEHVRALRNTDFGVRLGAYCVLKDNVAAGNGSTGLAGSFGCVASGNTASDNGGIGLFLGAAATVIGNVARDNVGDGINASTGSTVANNSVRSNNSGIVVTCPSNVVENTATNNGSGNIIFAGLGCGDTFNVVGP